MTVAILSLDTRSAPARVRFRCERPYIDEQRDLELDPPFATWIDAYATGQWQREALLTIGIAIGRWLDGRDHWLTRLAEAQAPATLVTETTKNPDALEQSVLDVPWELIVRVGERRTPAAAQAPLADLAPPIAALAATLGDIDWQHVRHAAPEPGVLLRVVRRIGPAAPHAALVAPQNEREPVVGRKNHLGSKSRLSPPASVGTRSTGVTGDQGPTRWSQGGSSPAPTDAWTVHSACPSSSTLSTVDTPSRVGARHTVPEVVGAVRRVARGGHPPPALTEPDLWISHPAATWSRRRRTTRSISGTWRAGARSPRSKATPPLCRRAR
jgi:hypothetical protein